MSTIVVGLVAWGYSLHEKAATEDELQFATAAPLRKEILHRIKWFESYVLRTREKLRAADEIEFEISLILRAPAKVAESDSYGLYQEKSLGLLPEYEKRTLESLLGELEVKLYADTVHQSTGLGRGETPNPVRSAARIVEAYQLKIGILRTELKPGPSPLTIREVLIPTANSFISSFRAQLDKI